ncbi:ArnT family glycosyltransferase [Leptothrix discophora]|uniref:Glycosyltransferase family 39 protein n=1 Tax=Leptothrix discophora TaxID=89 RepID=A0ABT9G6I3_LEPDI|nr:glycosyltransferase family 39 protein [Leptothrix discophora]MDP4302099.1 glycosyltransferase family 39 protein [Leptothrix discophora]
MNLADIGTADPARNGLRRDSARSAVAGTLVVVVLAFAVLRLLTLLWALGSPGDGGPGLHVDEAQYWHWSTALAWGYYSKPPVIAALLAGATALFGDGVLGVKSVGLILFPLTALVLGLFAARLAREHGADPRRAAGWTAALFLASPLAALLGLATTTDAPLLLCWSLASALLWHVRQANLAGHASRAGWLLLGLVCGIGLLSKYSDAAWLAGALAWLWLDRRQGLLAEVPALRRDARLGLLSAAGVCLAMLLPHLAWNAAMGWPTLQHTAEITAVSRPDGTPYVAELLRSLSVPLGVLLMAGPLLLAILPSSLRVLARQGGAGARLLLALHLPLLLLGMLQALRGEPQVNWVAPLVPGLVLALGLALALRPVTSGGKRLLVGLLALHTAAGAVVPLAQPLSQVWHDRVDAGSTLPRRLDIWARMRGWPEALADLHGRAGQALREHPDAPMLTTSRSVVAIAAHGWRDLPVRWRAWSAGGPPHSHYELTAAWPRAGAQRIGDVVLILADRDLPADLLERLDPPELLGTAQARAGTHSVVTLWLWRARLRSLSMDAPGPAERAVAMNPGVPSP